MKRIFILFILLTCLQGYAQLPPLFKVNSYFTLTNVEYDSTVYHEVHSFNKYYFFEQTFFIAPLNKVVLANILDTITFYKQYSNSVLIAEGELSIDSLSYIINANLDEENPINDTVFNLAPNGEWFIQSENGKYKRGEFILGNKTGLWNEYFINSYMSKEKGCIAEYFYRNDSLISSKSNNKVVTDSLKNMIQKRWYMLNSTRVNDIKYQYYSTDSLVQGIKKGNHIIFFYQMVFL